MLFDSDAVNAASLNFGTTMDQDMADPSDSVSGKEDSMEPGTSRSASVEYKDDSPLQSTPAATPAPSTKSKGKPKAPVQLIGHLPVATEDAMKTFVEIAENHYQYGTLGRSREAGESMTCDCQYEHGQLCFVRLCVAFVCAFGSRVQC